MDAVKADFMLRTRAEFGLSFTQRREIERDPLEGCYPGMPARRLLRLVWRMFGYERRKAAGKLRTRPAPLGIIKDVIS